MEEKERLINDLMTMTDEEWDMLFAALELLSSLNLVNKAL